MEDWKFKLFRFVHNRNSIFYFLVLRGIILILTLVFISDISSSVFWWQIYWAVSFLGEAVITLSRYSENIFHKNNILTLIMSNGTCFIYMAASVLYPLIILFLGTNNNAVPANSKSVLTLIFLILVNWGAVYFLAKKTSEYCKEKIERTE